jgi:hypothetical protein
MPYCRAPNSSWLPCEVTWMGSRSLKQGNKVDLTTIRFKLEARGVKPGDPIAGHCLRRFESEAELSLNENLVSMYENFNGFLTCDEWSQIFLWPLERILEYASITVRVADHTFYPIGDLLIDSDFIMCSLEKRSDVFLLHEERQLASDVPEFLENLVRGAFDFLKPEA